jgi:hypothetical protein
MRVIDIIKPLYEFAPPTDADSSVELLRTLADMVLKGQLEGELKKEATNIIVKVEKTARQIEAAQPAQPIQPEQPAQEPAQEPVQQPEMQTAPEEQQPVLAENEESDLRTIKEFLANSRGNSAWAYVQSMQQLGVASEAIAGVIKIANKQGQNQEFDTNQDAFKEIANLAIILARKVSGSLHNMKKAYDEQIARGDYVNPKEGEDTDDLPARPEPAMPPKPTKDKEPPAELTALITNTFAKVLGDAESITQRNARLRILKGFMSSCIEGIIDFEELLQNKRGNIISLLDEHEEAQQVMQWIGNLLLIKPSSTAGNWGPGELGLAILGTPVHKGGKGDLQVNGRDIELKASQNKDKGGRLGTTALQRGSDGKEKYQKALQDLFENIGYDLEDLDFSLKSEIETVTEARTKKPKQLKKSKLPSNNVGVYLDIDGSEKDIKWTTFGRTFVENALNPRIEGAQPEFTAQFLKSVATSCLIKKKEFPIGYDELTNWVDGCVNRDGTIDYNKFSVGYTKMLYIIYQVVDKKGEIMVLNPRSGSYYVTLGVDDFEQALSPSENNEYQHINIGSVAIDFTDSQGKASPQIGIA